MVKTIYLKDTNISFYIYNAKIIKIIDGDTIDVLVDLGFEIYKKVRCRLAGINSPKLNTNEGKAAKAFLISILPIDTPVIVFSKDYDKYGRSIAEIYQGDININKLMIDSGHAVPYVG